MRMKVPPNVPGWAIQGLLWTLLLPSQVSVVNQLDMQVVVSNVPPTYVEKNKDKLLRYDFSSFQCHRLYFVKGWRPRRFADLHVSGNWSLSCSESALQCPVCYFCLSLCIYGAFAAFIAAIWNCNCYHGEVRRDSIKAANGLEVKNRVVDGLSVIVWGLNPRRDLQQRQTPWSTALKLRSGSDVPITPDVGPCSVDLLELHVAMNA